MAKRRRHSALAFIIALASLCPGCSESAPRPFDSEKWKSGGKSERGGMIQDLQNRQLLKGKSKAEVEQLLGKPDEELTELIWRYEVVTIPRCNFWVCRMELGFDPRTVRTDGNVAVSD